MVSYFEWVQDLQRLFREEEEVTRREYQLLDRAFERVMREANVKTCSIARQPWR
ncbi:hypothetical protein [Bradyrhizobium sp. 153]|uniref:hypothetical protein n=1 Tax=Bradyrhizobium sp. 153 TaxID=2782627 RepID=UPI0031F793A0